MFSLCRNWSKTKKCEKIHHD